MPNDELQPTDAGGCPETDEERLAVYGWCPQCGGGNDQEGYAHLPTCPIQRTHGSPELDEDARKLEALGGVPGPTFADLETTGTRCEIQELYFWLGEEAERAGFTPWGTFYLAEPIANPVVRVVSRPERWRGNFPVSDELQSTR